VLKSNSLINKQQEVKLCTLALVGLPTELKRYLWGSEPAFREGQKKASGLQSQNINKGRMLSNKTNYLTSCNGMEHQKTHQTWRILFD
jgi:hypothetical protein